MTPAIPLRALLWFDAATCAAMGLLLTVAAVPLSSMLGLPRILLLEAGIVLLPFALFVAWTATRSEPEGPARLVVAANVAWVIGSVALLAGPWVRPTALGVTFVLIQAVAVAGIALLQAAGTRRQGVTA